MGSKVRFCATEADSIFSIFEVEKPKMRFWNCNKSEIFEFFTLHAFPDYLLFEDVKHVDTPKLLKKPK